MEFGWIGLGIIAFASTNIDDIFVLIGFLSQPEVRFRHVAAGQYAGLGFIIAVSLLGSYAALVIPRTWVGLLGAVPVAMGLTRLWLRHRAILTTAPRGVSSGITPSPSGNEPSTTVIPSLLPRRGWKNALAVALVTISNGSDNVATYVPLFANAGPAVKEMLAILFFSMVGLWCMLGYLMVTHRRWGNGIQRYGERMLPYVLILLGTLILTRSLLLGPR